MYHGVMNQIDWKNESAGHFEKHAEERLQDIYPWLLRDFIDFTGWQTTNRRILEIGCGPGFMLQQFSAASPALLVGVDASLAMLQRVTAAARAPKALLVQADACCLPFAEASFDAVFSRGSVFFWADLHAAFAGINRCLKPGGQVLIGGGYGISTPQQIIDEVRRAKSGSGKSGIPRLDPGQLAEIAVQAGGQAQVFQAPGRGFWVHWKL